MSKNTSVPCYCSLYCMGDIPSHAYGFERLPYNTVRSLKFNVKKPHSFLNEDTYQQLVSYYQVYFNQADEQPYLFGADDNVEEILGAGADTSKTVKVSKVARFKSIYVLGQKYSSIEATSARGSYFKAYYRDINLPVEEHCLRPAQIQYFFDTLSN